MTFNRLAKKSVRTVDGIVNFTVLIFLLGLLLYGGYAIWDSNNLYRAADSSQYAAYRPNHPEESLGFEELQAINPHVFGWITVYGTNIDYPLLQGDDNLKYVDFNARGEPAMTGAIFLDFRNNRNFTDFNNIIYGHDMARNAMFGEIANFEDEDYFNERQFGMIFTGERNYGVEFFAFLLVDAHDMEIYNPFLTDPAGRQRLINRFESDAIQFRDVDVTISDRLVVLSTCTPSATNGRHILVGRLTENVMDDPFAGEIVRGGGIDILNMGTLGLASGSLIIFGIIGSIIFFMMKKKQKKEAEEAKEKAKQEALKAAEEAGETIVEEPVVNSVKKRRPPTVMEDFTFLMTKIFLVFGSFVLLLLFVFGVTRMPDDTMAPAFREGDIVFFQRIGVSRLLAGDLVVVRSEGGTQIRRVVAVAGDEVNITYHGLMINGLRQQEMHIFEDTAPFSEIGVEFPLVVPEGHVFVLGDSRTRATDSRIYGPVRIDDLLGSVVTFIRGRDL